MRNNIYSFPGPKAGFAAASQRTPRIPLIVSCSRAVKAAVREAGWTALTITINVLMAGVMFCQWTFAVLTIALLGKLYIHWHTADMSNVALECLTSFGIYCLAAGLRAYALRPIQQK